MSAPAIIPPTELNTILHELANGTSLLTLAERYGVSKQALHQRLDRFCASGKADTTLYDAVTDYITDRVFTHIEERATATSMLDATRARDNANDWKWIAERRRPKIYGVKQEMNVDLNHTIIVNRMPVPQHIDKPQPIMLDSSEVIDINNSTS